MRTVCENGGWDDEIPVGADSIPRQSINWIPAVLIVDAQFTVQLHQEDKRQEIAPGFVRKVLTDLVKMGNLSAELA